MTKKILGLLFILAFLFMPEGTKAQQILDESNIFIFDNTDDANTSTTGTFMNDPRYREFPQAQNLGTDFYGFWSNVSAIYSGGNSRRASRYGSGDNTGAHMQFYCTLQETDYYVVYHHMNSANATTDAYVTFQRFGEGLPADSFRYNQQNNMRYFDIMQDGRLAENARGTWYPMGIIQLFAADSSLTVEIGLDSVGSNTLRADAIALVRSTQSGPDLEFGNRRFTYLYLDPATQDTIINYNFAKDRAPVEFPQTTFKWGMYNDKKIMLYNYGNAPLTVSGFQTGTSRFNVITPAPIVIPVGGKQEITIRFSPLGEETTVDYLTIYSDDALEPEATIPLIGTGINYNFVLNASLDGSEPHWNAPLPGAFFDLIGTSWLASTPSPWQFPVVGGNIKSVVNTGSDVNISATYRFTIPDTIYGSYFIEHAGPVFSSNAAQQVTVDVVTPFYSNPNPALGDTQRVLGFNSRLSETIKPWVRIGGNTVFQLNGGGQTSVRFTNPIQGGSELLRADLLRVRLVPIAPTISTSLDPSRLLNFGSVSIYDSIRQIQFNFQRNFTIGSNGETPLQIDSIWLKDGSYISVNNMPNLPLVLPAIDGQYNLLITFLPNDINLYRDTLFIRSNDQNDSLVAILISGQGVGTGIIVDDGDPSNYVYPSEIVDWTGTPDPLNMDKWYRVTGSGNNNNRLFTYIYFNPTTDLEKIEWYPYFPFKPGSSTNEIDSFDVYVQTPAGSAISSPQARYVINHAGPNSPEVKYINQNAIAYGGDVGANGRVFLGRYLFMRGGQDYHGGGTIFGSVELHNDTAAVNAFYADTVNIALQDSFVLRADAIIFEQAGASDIYAEPNMTPTEYSLSQNYPNPFNPTTQIRFSIPTDGRVELKIYDILGREVATLMNDDIRSGYYTVEWNGKNDYGVKVSSGVYIYRIVSGKFVQTKKMMMLK